MNRLKKWTTIPTDAKGWNFIRPTLIRFFFTWLVLFLVVSCIAGCIALVYTNPALILVLIPLLVASIVVFAAADEVDFIRR